MLGKLLKHEFRATGRVLLPAMGAVLALALLANLSARLLQHTGSQFLSVLFVLVIVAFVFGMIALCVMNVVIMVLRFYRNLLGNEGYLMHTLPVSVHELVCAKLIVSLVWFVATGLLVTLLIALTALLQSGTDLGELLHSIPSLSDLRRLLLEAGLRHPELRRLNLLVVEFGLGILIGAASTFLHFYAAMALGQMFAKNKVLMSVLFYVGLSMVISTMANTMGMGMVMNQMPDPDTLESTLRFMQRLFTAGLLMSLVQTALLYLATVLPLQKKLNLG